LLARLRASVATAEVSRAPSNQPELVGEAASSVPSREIDATVRADGDDLTDFLLGLRTANDVACRQLQFCEPSAGTLEPQCENPRVEFAPCPNLRQILLDFGY
jgi:hypothetical protein